MKYSDKSTLGLVDQPAPVTQYDELRQHVVQVRLSGDLSDLADALIQLGCYFADHRDQEQSEGREPDLVFDGRAAGMPSEVKIVILGESAQTPQDRADARECFDEALELSRTLKDRSLESRALFFLADLALDAEELERARELTQLMLAIDKAQGDELGICGALITLSNIASWGGDELLAHRLMKEAEQHEPMWNGGGR